MQQNSSSSSQGSRCGPRDDSDAEHVHALSHVGDHTHEHGDSEQAYHRQAPRALGIIRSVFHHHRHDDSAERALESSAEGIRTLQISLVGLAVTAILQLVIALSSGSVGLLADTIHNFSDAFTALPLWLAFVLSRRPANRRYTYGYGRAEDLAGVAIVIIIGFSAVLALAETYQKLVHPTPLHHVSWVAGAALVGFVGNEAVALLRLRTGRRIGSAALQADGDHARVDGLTSLAVLAGAIGVWLGAPIADPIVGLVIGIVILFVAKDAAVSMWHRLMDAVDPELCVCLDQVAQSTPGVRAVHDVRLRWSGHRLLGELNAEVASDLTVAEAHTIAEEIRHRAFHALPRLAQISVHLDPEATDGTNPHAVTAHHAQG